ncbi:aldo/keto reductase [Jeotgalibaca sp. MA1X17-3]|uniref:aldo/keto reductase n=1 Tax=Jeotgalibaca sp. MA1X17-3 TaxID=2908211 RepID=UPI001F20DABC|nr:aldo/keto reductase [Jeotgalibaca sp. MA1X17-3]UJF15358.1 aldo/keto reductase [Jeotgalibaca sp. MA1X17-3]
MLKNVMDRLPLNDGYTIPGIGFGTSGIPDRDAEELIFMAIMRGYRLIDTASWYKNEEGVGRGIKKAINAGISREDIFVVSKVWKDEMGYHETAEAFERSYERLGLDYIDLYLIHWPSSKERENLETWRALEELKDSGRVRSIGVSNFNRGELNEILKESRVKPSVNQLPVNPENSNADLDDFCYSNNIVVMGYSPLGAGKVNKDKKLATIGNKYYKSPAQIALKWSIDRDVVPIPKTSHAERMVENLELFDFELTEEDMELLNSIDQQNDSSRKRKDDNQGRRHGSRRS